MSSQNIRLTTTCLLLGAATAAGLAQVVSWEGTSLPEVEGWERTEFCTPERWVDGTWFHQVLGVGECGAPPGGDRDSYRRSLEPFNSAAQFFLEFRVQTDGERSEIPGGAPTVVAMGNDAGGGYNLTVARDLVKFLRDVDLPIWFIETEPGVAHTYRIELYCGRYAFYIDGCLIDDGLADGPFPAYDPRITWRGKSWYLPCENAWDYIRYGVIPVDGSGDFDSDEDVDGRDFYFLHECLTNARPGINGGPAQDAGPGCRFADFDDDADVDLRDLAAFQLTFTGGE